MKLEELYTMLKAGEVDTIARHLATLHPCEAAILMIPLMEYGEELALDVALHTAVHGLLQSEPQNVRPGLHLEVDARKYVVVEPSMLGASVQCVNHGEAQHSYIPRAKLREAGRYFFALARFHDGGGTAGRHRANDASPMDKEAS